MDYSKPIDAAFFPEGCERCSLTKFMMWMGAWGVVTLIGLFAAILVLSKGLGVTGLDDYYGFGLWIAFDLAVIALGAGAFFLSLLRYILNISELKHVVTFAVTVGFLCYSGAMMILVLDIGMPIRSWFGYMYANVHSMLTEVIFCITCYLIVLIIESIPTFLENPQFMKNKVVAALAHNFHVMMPLFAGIGAFLSTFHQGSLGGMYGVLFGRPYLFREGFFVWPWTFFLYIMSAIATGPMFSCMLTVLSEKITGKQLISKDVKMLLAKIGGVLILIYAIFKTADSIAWVTSLLSREGQTFDQMFNGLAFGSWIFYLEHLLLIPAALLVLPKVRENLSLVYGLMACGIISITINRYIQTVQGLAVPVMPFDQWTLYIPNWVEWACCGLVLGYSMLVISISYRYFPLFPQEKELN